MKKDVSNIDLSINLYGEKYNVPVIIKFNLKDNCCPSCIPKYGS
jgi:hypothetical protein